MPVTIAVDAMGGDHGPSVTVPASLQFLEEHADARVILVGLEAGARCRAREGALAREGPHLGARRAAKSSTMDEPPADALRKKKDSSMRVAINLVKDGEAQACVSAGNTGALMAIARFVLKTLPGIDRPAIASQLPTRKGVTTALDLGANVNCTPEQLVQFAVMGSALASAVDGIERPTVGLLNIGEEDIKGNDVVKETAELLKSAPINFYGNVEGDDIYRGHHRRRRLRRLRRQRRAQGVRRPRRDAVRVPAQRSSRAIPRASSRRSRPCPRSPRSRGASTRAATTAPRSSA